MVKKHNKLNHFLLTFFSVHLTGISNTFILIKKGQKPRIPLERRNLPKKLVKYYTLSDWLITATIMQSGPCPTSSEVPVFIFEVQHLQVWNWTFIYNGSMNHCRTPAQFISLIPTKGSWRNVPTLYWAPDFPALFWISSTTDEIGHILFLFYFCLLYFAIF